MLRVLEKTNPNYAKKIEQLQLSGGVEVDLDNMVPLITNRIRFPDAPRYLPKLILIRNKKILVLKEKENVVKFKNGNVPLTDLLLCEPWRNAEDINNLEINPTVMEEAKKRRKDVMPFSAEVYPEMRSGSDIPDDV